MTGYDVDGALGLARVLWTEQRRLAGQQDRVGIRLDRHLLELNARGLGGLTCAEIAERLGVHENTVYRRVRAAKDRAAIPRSHRPRAASVPLS